MRCSSPFPLPSPGSPADSLKDTLVAAAAATLLEVSRVLSSDSVDLESTTPAPVEKRIMVPISPFSEFVTHEPWQSQSKKPCRAQELQALAAPPSLQTQLPSSESIQLSTQIHLDVPEDTSKAPPHPAESAPTPPQGASKKMRLPSASCKPAKACALDAVPVSNVDMIAFHVQQGFFSMNQQNMEASQHAWRMLEQRAAAILPLAHMILNGNHPLNAKTPCTPPLLKPPLKHTPPLEGTHGQWDAEPGWSAPQHFQGDTLMCTPQSRLSGHIDNCELDLALCMLQQAQEMTADANRRLRALSAAPQSRSPKEQASLKRKLPPINRHSSTIAHQSGSNPHAAPEQSCSDCGTRSSPAWRRAGVLRMCNACGLRHRRSMQLHMTAINFHTAEGKAL